MSSRTSVMTTRLSDTCRRSKSVMMRSCVSGRGGFTPWRGTAMPLASARPIAIVRLRLSRRDHHRLLRARIEHHGHDVDLLGSGDLGHRGIAALAGTDGALEEQDTHGQEADPAQSAHDDATSFLRYCRASSSLTLKANPMSRISESAVHMSPYPSRAARYPKTKAPSALPLSTAALNHPTTAPRRAGVVASVTSAA